MSPLVATLLGLALLLSFNTAAHLTLGNVDDKAMLTSDDYETGIMLRSSNDDDDNDDDDDDDDDDDVGKLSTIATGAKE